MGNTRAFTLERTLVLDGGLSNQLEAQGHDLRDALWTARVLSEHPEAIVEAHLAYLLAGADVITTSSYQATDPELIARSVNLAREAIERARRLGVERPLWVAGSLGPFGAILADGSEYRGNYGLSFDELVAFHRPRMAALAGADVLALETVPDALEAEAMVSLLEQPAWLTYSSEGGRTRAGEPLEEAFARTSDRVVGTGVNCSSPEDALQAVRIAARVSSKPVVVYPNSGERWDATARAFVGDPTFDRELALTWQSAGARLIGGCCRVGPDAIAALAARLRATPPG